MITWPSLLTPSAAGFAPSVKSSALRTEMDSGRFRQRARFNKEYRQISVTFDLTDDELQLFQSTYHHLLTDGADWFSMSLPLGEGFRDFTVRFVADSYNIQYQNVMHWFVTATLETEDDPTLDAEIIAAFAAIGFSIDDYELAATLLHQLIHETLPELN